MPIPGPVVGASHPQRGRRKRVTGCAPSDRNRARGRNHAGEQRGADDARQGKDSASRARHHADQCVRRARARRCVGGHRDHAVQLRRERAAVDAAHRPAAGADHRQPRRGQLPERDRNGGHPAGAAERVRAHRPDAGRAGREHGHGGRRPGVARRRRGPAGTGARAGCRGGTTGHSARDQRAGAGQHRSGDIGRYPARGSGTAGGDRGQQRGPHRSHAGDRERHRAVRQRPAHPVGVFPGGGADGARSDHPHRPSRHPGGQRAQHPEHQPDKHRRLQAAVAARLHLGGAAGCAGAGPERPSARSRSLPSSPRSASRPTSRSSRTASSPSTPCTCRSACSGRASPTPSWGRRA